jgi:hypothetical protein
MGGPAMTRYSAAVPIAVLVGLPLWTAPSLLVMVVGAIAGLFCAAGALRLWLPAITFGASLALIDYALSLWLLGGGVDIVGATAFGLALVFLLDLTDFALRFRGAQLGASVKRTQIAFWLGRSVVAVAAVVLLTLCAAVFASAIPVVGRPIVAGLGVVIAFAAALRAGIVRGGGDGS